MEMDREGSRREKKRRRGVREEREGNLPLSPDWLDMSSHECAQDEELTQTVRNFASDIAYRSKFKPEGLKLLSLLQDALMLQRLVTGTHFFHVTLKKKGGKIEERHETRRDMREESNTTRGGRREGGEKGRQTKEEESIVYTNIFLFSFPFRCLVLTSL